MTPRERMIEIGFETLSDAELIAVITRRREAQDATDTQTLSRQAQNDHDLSAALEFARRVLREQMQHRNCLSSPQAVRDYLRLKLQDRPHEVFVCVFLDAQNRILADEELFRGTLTQMSVYPREVVKRALAHNAAALIFAHNHPSGVAEPSRADEALTLALKQALALVDVKVLDHFVIGAGAAMSFAERGLL